uniref:Uncharacterized protein n=1 Tax=Periophthalmus magnuspinnatus TaxID=409849 RepID=A0A3B3ZKG4_9GOBI
MPVSVFQGVKCFDHNVPLQLIVTGGSDCAVRLWARYVTTRPLATLLGHHAAVIDVAIYQPVEQIFSYSRDAVSLRIWDITTHGCLKTVRLHFPCLQAAQIPEHGNFPFLLLSQPLPDEMSPHLLVGCKDYLALLSLSDRQGLGQGGRLTDQLADGRPKVPLSCALYNPTLQQVVTGSMDSTVCVWDLETGRKALHISSSHGEEELSCMALDTSQRRLITGAHNGTIKVIDHIISLECSVVVATLLKSVYRNVPPVDCLIFLQHRAGNRHLRNKGVLVSSQSDDCVLTLSSNQSENTVLVSGDTAGRLHIWDISHYGLDIPDQVGFILFGPPLLHCWRAHTGAVMAAEVLKMADTLFILSASADGSAGLWTQDGDHAGSFGQEVLWNLTDACSFQAKRFMIKNGHSIFYFSDYLQCWE